MNADGVGTPASIEFTTPIGAREHAFCVVHAVGSLMHERQDGRRVPGLLCVCHAGTVSDWIALHTLLFALVVAFSGTLSIALSIVAIWRVHFGPARVKTMTPSSAVLPPPVDVRLMQSILQGASWLRLTPRIGIRYTCHVHVMQSTEEDMAIAAHAKAKSYAGGK